MPAGGRLTIETSNVDLDDTYAASHAPTTPGKYVMLSVSDTGCGMDAGTLARIFEPFFTTKEVGKGTGLGLSTSYGIVKQSGGFIWAYSEPGLGSVFKIYLPRVDARPEKAAKRHSSPHLGGKETILVVEDDDLVRGAVTRMLEARGYHLLIARNAAEAIEIAARCAGAIQLILSDVVMPDVSGFEVVRRVRELSSPIPALFMSGYSDHPLLRGEGAQPGINFLQKPFAPETLARKVREVLDA
jgi:two-component system, cell cycle sensor histidine kinase and response regulator CckA